MMRRNVKHHPWRRQLPIVSTLLLLLPLSTAWSPVSLKSCTRRKSPTSFTVQSPRHAFYSCSLRMSSPPDTVDEVYYTQSWSDPAIKYGLGGGGGSVPGAKITLTRWLSAKVQDFPELRDMESLHLSIQMACKTISNLIHSSSGIAPATTSDDTNNPRDNSMKRLDHISKTILQNALRFTGRLRVVEAPRNENSDEEGPASHQPGVTIAYALDQYGSGKEGRKISGVDDKWGRARRLAACFDPLDGSGNADAAICTGTVFGVFDADAGFKGGESPDLTSEASLARAVLQPGNKLLAAGYCLYSSTTILVFSLGGGTHGFTLDPTINEFVLTHPNMKIPKRGNIYSCNEAYSESWDENFKRYLKTIKTGTGQTGQRYTQRYIGSMVGDVHRTLTYGGIFCYPSDNVVHPKGNLQLVYKSAPMAYILEHAGGKSSNGQIGLLSVTPKTVHERSPCFMGSPDDMDELMSYIDRNAEN
ncbi:hypothetical protein HJC23_012938 [Cyclotella cryptica]|uniref:fructose-bisphosphatase n=1 Tax=Cyclotella cryptica TaxID=29204 RepID=A0ABD3Q432_9STRA|eukprot:CCRYP_009282-RB/>CCRYP_009282-RB protein AED:0.04 eAED:0.04 QI:163/1/1/1/0.8/0.66/6/1790/473